MVCSALCPVCSCCAWSLSVILASLMLALVRLCSPPELLPMPAPLVPTLMLSAWYWLLLAMLPVVSVLLVRLFLLSAIALSVLAILPPWRSVLPLTLI